jgi:hypothetical protein
MSSIAVIKEIEIVEVTSAPNTIVVEEPQVVVVSAGVGIIGPAGPKGDTGNVGPQGPQGESGGIFEHVLPDQTFVIPERTQVFLIGKLRNEGKITINGRLILRN